jgi:hypothetical protein
LPGSSISTAVAGSIHNAGVDSQRRAMNLQPICRPQPYLIKNATQFNSTWKHQYAIKSLLAYLPQAAWLD